MRPARLEGSARPNMQDPYHGRNARLPARTHERGVRFPENSTTESDSFRPEPPRPPEASLRIFSGVLEPIRGGARLAWHDASLDAGLDYKENLGATQGALRRARQCLRSR